MDRFRYSTAPFSTDAPLRTGIKMFHYFWLLPYLLFLALTNNLSDLLLEGLSVISPLDRGIQIGGTLVVGIGKHGDD